MLKCFPIDFIRQALEQTMLKEHIVNENFYGGKNQVNILSFYEHLQTQEQVDRFVETYRDLTDQQNRANLIMNGVLVAPENPTITNLYSSLIVPMAFTCSFLTTLGDRDSGIITINNLIEQLKGRKIDIAQLNGADYDGKPCSVPFVVGTIGENDGAPAFENGDYIGSVNSASDIMTLVSQLSNKGISFDLDENSWCYVENNGILKVACFVPGSTPTWNFIVEDGNHHDIIFPPTHTSFEKYKLSLSFDAIRCDEPRTLNSEEYCTLSFGGSATLVNESLQLGNDLLKIKVSKNKIVASTDITYSANAEYLEPLELPSGNNVNTQINQLVSNNFKSNSHADSISITLQYTFMVDFASDLIKNWFNYARYGTHTTATTGVSPNTIYEISEIWSSWGVVSINTFKAKIIENIDIENTESDTLTIATTFQVQGDNN